MKNIINKVVDFIDRTFKERKPEIAMFLQESTLIPGRGKIRVYVVGKKRDKFKFVYLNKDVYRVKYTRRLITDRMPMAELETGIHDEMLSEFAKTRVSYYRQ